LPDALEGAPPANKGGTDAASAPEDGSNTVAAAVTATTRLDSIALVDGGGEAATEQRVRPSNDGGGKRAKPDAAF